MVAKMIARIGLTLLFISALQAEDDAWDMFDEMSEALGGKWTLSAPQKQTGTLSYQHPGLKEIVGNPKRVGIEFTLIGGEVTLMEDLLPHTVKKMVTMYHCKDIACTTLKATHYCSKQNQPQFIMNLKKSGGNTFVFDCDMSTELCQSKEDHVHQIVHQLSEGGKHLKISYFSWQEGKLKKSHSIYHFDKQ